MIAASRNAPSTLEISSFATSRTRKKHKLSSPWEGPFTAAKVTRPGSYRLQTLEGEDVNNSWNIDQLYRFYTYSIDYPRGSSLHDYSKTPFAVSGLRVQALVSGLLYSKIQR
jgi:hypothetical protein